MLNSCFRFRCAIVQAGTVVILPPYHPPSQAPPPPLCGPLVFWQHSFRQILHPSKPPPAPHVWFVLRLFSLGCSENYFPTSFYYILVFNLNAACMSMPGRQAYQAYQPAPCLPLNFCQIVQQLSSPVAVRQCTMWSVVQLLKRVDVVTLSRETCR